MHQFAQHQKKRNLVSIHRSEIDDHAIQGFVLASSEEPLLRRPLRFVWQLP